MSVISEQTQKSMFPQAGLKPTSVLLRTYTGEPMVVAGEMTAKVQYGTQSCTLPLLVVAGNGPTLLGRDWLRHLQLDWKSIGLAALDRGQARVQALTHKYSDVFAEKLGKMRYHKAALQIQQNARPIFCKPRPVPFALKDAASRELDRLESAGILVRVSHSDWAAPIVLVPKGDGCIRLCADYKVTINPSLDIDQYPLPKPDDLFTSLTGGKKFTTLDLTQAYQQMPLVEESQQYSTINTHQGLYQFTRLPFGVASAPAIFQRTMDTILQGIPHVLCYLDDLLITGTTEDEHLQNLDEVLRRLQHHGITVKRSKCHFLKDSVEYLGHKIDADGLHTTTKKVKAVQQAPRPVNPQQLRSFLGLLQYYGKFIPNLSTLLSPLNALLLKNQAWNWTNECERAFKEAKMALSSASILVHYNPKLPLRLAADASAYGVGAVISHIYPSGEERPIAYASRTLTASEKNYSQLEKEALSLIFGVKKFHQYLYGRRFTLYTDHKPLTTILGPKRGVPPIAAARLQRWALFLSAYNYSIEFKSTTAHANADCLSRLPLPTSSKSSSASQTVPNADIFVVRQIEALPVTAVELRAATRRDPILSKVLQYTKRGWPAKVPDVLKPYHNRRDQLTLEDDCVMWGVRVIVPRKLQERVLQELHQSHLGIARSKALARSHVWWPKLDSAIENMTKSCTGCQAVRSEPAVAPLHPWLWPDRPWQRIHIDFAGPFRGRQFLIIVDAHSKWPEIIQMQTTTSSATIHELRRLFSSYGLPEQLVSDNGPQFVSDEFQVFLKSNRVKHIRSAPYHPSSNGLAERFVRTFKRSLRATEYSKLTFNQQLLSFLLSYRTTPHTTTGATPASLFLNRHLRTRLDLLHPSVSGRVTAKQAKQKEQHDEHARTRNFTVGQRVLVRNFRDGPKWVPGTLIARHGPLSFLVQVGEDVHWRRHVDHLLETVDSPHDASPPETVLPPSSLEHLPPSTPESHETELPTSPNLLVPESISVQSKPEPDSAAPEPPTSSVTITPPQLRYPQRNRHPPERYTDLWQPSRIGGTNPEERRKM